MSLQNTGPGLYNMTGLSAKVSCLQNDHDIGPQGPHFVDTLTGIQKQRSRLLKTGVSALGQSTGCSFFRPRFAWCLSAHPNPQTTKDRPDIWGPLPKPSCPMSFFPKAKQAPHTVSSKLRWGRDERLRASVW